jgi:membrane-bound acyltransferase YfiQ involved in biofilm formation
MYAGTLFFRALGQRMPQISSMVARISRQVLQNPWRVFIVALPSAFFLLPTGHLATPKALLPIPNVFAAYIFCFFVGYQLYQLRHELDRIFQAWPQYLGLGLIASAANQYGFLQDVTGHSSRLLTLMSALSGGLACWGMVFGLIGFFLHFFSKASPVLDYLVDASYWVYLIHVPIVVATAIFLNGIEISSYVKFILGIVSGAVLSLLSYQWFVRYSMIGYILHGKRVKKVPSPPQFAPCPSLQVDH